MSLRKIKRYLNILLYLYSNKTITLNQISQEFDIAYSTLSAMFKKWIDEKYLTRIEIDITYAGEDRYRYQITEEGINYLKNLEKKLKETLKS